MPHILPVLRLGRCVPSMSLGSWLMMLGARMPLGDVEQGLKIFGQSIRLDIQPCFAMCTKLRHKDFASGNRPSLLDYIRNVCELVVPKRSQGAGWARHCVITSFVQRRSTRRRPRSGHVL